MYELIAAGALALVTELDPYGLEPGTPEGSPHDEYEPEAADLARLLVKNGAVTADDVERVWLHWFSESLVLRRGASRVAQLVEGLNCLMSGARPPIGPGPTISGC